MWCWRWAWAARLDASNVIDVPEAAVITAMGMDHTAMLGPTLADIAAAKAGIIKPGGAVVSCGGCPEADDGHPACLPGTGCGR